MAYEIIPTYLGSVSSPIYYNSTNPDSGRQLHTQEWQRSQLRPAVEVGYRGPGLGVGLASQP